VSSVRSRVIRRLTVTSIALGLFGAWLIGYSVIDKFTAREYGDVGFGGVVARTPEYVAWAKLNDCRTIWGLALITVGSVLQLVLLYIPSSSRSDETAARP
jgi:hypothetical protein